MEITFGKRTEWRGRGRPPREPSERAVRLLRHTAATGELAIIPLDGTTPAELTDLKADLKAAKRKLGGEIHFQIVGNVARFFWEPPARRGQP